MMSKGGRHCLLIIPFLTLADGFVQTFVSPHKMHQIHHDLRLFSTRRWADSSTQLNMGRFDMEVPFRPAAPLHDATDPSAMKPTLTSFIGASQDQDLTLLFTAISSAIKAISTLTRRASLTKASGSHSISSEGGESYVGEKVKKLDLISNEVLNHHLLSSGMVAVIANEEDDQPLVAESSSAPFVVVHDPLDGSSNIEAGIPVGTIIGIYRNLFPNDPTTNSLQPGKDLVAACYALYSSSTQMVVSFGVGTHCFTLDSDLGEFVLTHRNMRLPQSGATYSVNDGRYADWPDGLKQYIDTIRRGQGRTKRVYRPCYICSLIADVHYTFFHGGIAMNPRRHLRLVYEANPIGFIVKNAGGKASDGCQPLLHIKPEKLHHRLPVFVGSAEDVAELESFKDVQQLGDFKYVAVN